MAVETLFPKGPIFDMPDASQCKTTLQMTKVNVR